MLINQLVELTNKEEIAKIFSGDKEILQLSHEQLLDIMLVGFAKHKKEATEAISKQYDIDIQKSDYLLSKIKEVGSKLYESMNSGQLNKLRYIQSVQQDPTMPSYLKPCLQLINMELIGKLNGEQSKTSGKKQQKINQISNQEQHPEPAQQTQQHTENTQVPEQPTSGQSQHRRRKHQKVSE